MKKIKYSVLFIASFFYLSSCEFNENEENKTNNDSFIVENEVLSFKSSDDLKLNVDALKDESKNLEIISKLEQSYKNGFLPLNPQTEDEVLIQKIVSERNKSIKSKNVQSRLIEVDGEVFDVEDDLILDDEFASFLNANREIIVNDILYTYTEKGTYTTHKSNLSLMRDYIESADIQEYTTLPNPGTYSTEDDRISLVVPNTNPCGSLNISQSLSPEIQEFDTNSNNCYSGNYSGGSVGNSGSSSSTYVDHTQNLRNYANSLTACSSSNNFMGIFGPDRRC